LRSGDRSGRVAGWRNKPAKTFDLSTNHIARDQRRWADLVAGSFPDLFVAFHRLPFWGVSRLVEAPNQPAKALILISVAACKLIRLPLSPQIKHFFPSPAFPSFAYLSLCSPPSLFCTLHPSCVYPNFNTTTTHFNPSTSSSSIYHHDWS
jgi:hypothetical protein